MTIVESWIVEDPAKDKTALYGMDVPAGTWMVSMKVDDEKIYNDAKEGTIKGFSIEGYFADRYDLNKKSDKQKTIDKLKDLLK